MTSEEELQKIREQEDFELAEHFDKIVQVIQAKCQRCRDTKGGIYGCLGCSLSHGEIGYRLKECVELLRIDCSRLDKQYPQLIKND